MNSRTKRKNLHGAPAVVPLSVRVDWCINTVDELIKERGKFYLLSEGIRQRLAPSDDSLSPDDISYATADVLGELLADAKSSYRLLATLQGIQWELTRNAETPAS